MVDTTRLENKVIVITGAASGIGRACAIRYAAEGAKVVLADINAEAGETAAKSIRDEGGEAIFQYTDVSETDQLEALLQRGINEYGHV
ncbi:MAG: SDR family NAD(P)-dependent oxidoreductase, partial [Chloroflexota bacterium]